MKTYVACLLAGLAFYVALPNRSMGDQITPGFTWTQTSGPVFFNIGAASGGVGTGEVKFNDLVIRASTDKPPINLQAPPVGGPPFQINSFFDVFVDLSIDGSPNPPVANSFFDVFTELNINDATNMNGGSSMSGGSTTYDTEIVQLQLSGGTVPGLPPIVIRESPSKQSTGTVTVTNDGGGTFHIDSFFDIFTELSLDGGVHWAPSTNSSGQETSVEVASPLPATAWTGLTIMGLLGLSRARRSSKISGSCS